MGSFIDFLRANFWHAAPVLVIAAIAVAIILERFQALSLLYPMRNRDGFFEKIRDLVMSDQVAEAIALCDRYGNKPVARVVREGLLRAHQPEALIEDGLEIAVSEAHQKISKRTPFLATFANVATLMGLFGTIIGLIRSFEAVGAVQAQQRAALLASGISTAMNATMLGLGVAIPCMIAYAFLMNRTNRLSVEVDQSAVKTIDLIRQRYYSADNSRSA